MSTPRYDAVIAGGGLSGLSLAARLAAGTWRDRRVLLVDDDTAPAVQSWAFWAPAPAGQAPSRAAPADPQTALRNAPGDPPGGDAGPDPVGLGAAVSVSFDRVRVHADGATRLLPLGRYRYQVVRRPDLRRVVLDLLARRPGFEVRTGRVEAVSDRGGHAETVVDGHLVRSDWAFDSVTPPPGPGAARHPSTAVERAHAGAEALGEGGYQGVDARLAFTGWEVRCPRPVFDPATPLLFDFRTAQRGGSRFVYVLPADAHRALVELTSFVPRRAAPPGRQDREAALVTYLREVVGCAEYEILRSEAAVLPLRCFPPPRRRGRVLAIGAAGGLVKASTGYAFQRIQRDSAAIAGSLARYGHPFRLPRRRWYGMLDAVLLDVLDHDPPRLERTFAALFAGNPADRVLAFLDEDTALADELRLIASLPPPPYLRAVVRCAARATRRPRTGPAKV